MYVDTRLDGLKKTVCQESHYLSLFKQSVIPMPNGRVIAEVMWYAVNP